MVKPTPAGGSTNREENRLPMGNWCDGDFATVILLQAMRMLWCWRCKAEMPMLEEEEYIRVISLRPSGGTNLQERFAKMLAEYERITGFRETDPNAVFHHRLAIYGPPCRFCGKPLRTPQAKLCGACMKPIADDLK
jgi:hypothetical protein